MIEKSEISDKRESVFTYHERGITRCWAVGRLLRDLRKGRLVAETVISPLMEETARGLYGKGGLGDERLRDISSDPERLLRPGVLTELEGFNDGRSIIVDGRHRYVALTMMYGHLPMASMKFYSVTEEQMAAYEIRMESNFTDHEAAVWAQHVSAHVD